MERPPGFQFRQGGEGGDSPVAVDTMNPFRRRATIFQDSLSAPVHTLEVGFR